MKEPKWLDRLADAVKNSICIADVCRALGFDRRGGGNADTIKKWIDRKGLSTQHFDLSKARARGLNKGAGRKGPLRFPADKVLIQNSWFSKNVVRRLLKERLAYICSECGIGEIYNGKSIVLQMDHLNGINTDNRLENLRWLCPNCHSQTETFGNKRGAIKRTCGACTKEYRGENGSRFCSRKCASPNIPRARKVTNRPSKQELVNLVEEFGWSATGRKFGVSDNTIRKWLK